MVGGISLIWAIPTKSTESKNKECIIGIGLVWRMVVGAVIGVVTDNIGLWLSLGMAIGAGVGPGVGPAALHCRLEKRSEKVRAFADAA